MEEIFKEMMDKYQDIRRNGKILVDIQVPQVNSRIHEYQSGKWYNLVLQDDGWQGI